MQVVIATPGFVAHAPCSALGAPVTGCLELFVASIPSPVTRPYVPAETDHALVKAHCLKTFRETSMDDARPSDALLSESLAVLRRCVPTLETGFVKLLRLRRSSGKRVPLPGPLHPLGSPLCTRNVGPTRESLPHLHTVL